MLPKDGTARIGGQVVSGFDNLIPPRLLANLDTLSQSMTEVAADMHQLLQPRTVEAVDHPGATTRPELGNLSTIAQRMDALLRRMNELLKPGEGDVAATLANLRKVSENAIEISKTMQEFSTEAVQVAKSANGTFQVATTQLDRVGESLFDNSARLAKGLDSLNQALALIAEGKGTAGKLLNDPALYESLLLASDRLHGAIIDLQSLLRKWEAEGIGLKLK
jgi:methyl-accepting chemotaxis protein